MEQKNDALLPCPFCGEKPETKEWIQRGLEAMRIWCDTCGVSPHIQTVKQRAIEVWNTRPTPAPLSKGDARSWYLLRVDGDSGEIWYELHDVTDEEDWQIAQNSFIKFMGLKAKDDCNAYAEMLKARGDSVI